MCPLVFLLPFSFADRSTSQSDTISWCKAHGVTVNAYMPLGVPDWWTFPTSNGMSSKPLNDPTLAQVCRVLSLVMPFAVVDPFLPCSSECVAVAGEASCLTSLRVYMCNVICDASLTHRSRWRTIVLLPLLQLRGYGPRYLSAC